MCASEQNQWYVSTETTMNCRALQVFLSLHRRSHHVHTETYTLYLHYRKLLCLSVLIVWLSEETLIQLSVSHLGAQPGVSHPFSLSDMLKHAWVSRVGVGVAMTRSFGSTTRQLPLRLSRRHMKTVEHMCSPTDVHAIRKNDTMKSWLAGMHCENNFDRLTSIGSATSNCCLHILVLADTHLLISGTIVNNMLVAKGSS